MKRDVKIGLFVAAVICGVAAVLLGGGLVGSRPQAPPLRIDPAAVSEDVFAVAPACRPGREEEAGTGEQVALDGGVVVESRAVAPEPSEPLDFADDGAVFIDDELGTLPPLKTEPVEGAPALPEPAARARAHEEAADVAWGEVAALLSDEGPARPEGPAAAAPACRPGREKAAWEEEFAPALPDLPIAPPALVTAPPRSKARHYTVRRGESFFTISKKLFGTVRYFHDIQKANPDLEPRRLRPGQKIVIPDVPGVKVREHLLAGREPEPPRRPKVYLAQDRIHVVAPKEILEEISLRYYKTRHKWRHILKANPGLDPKKLMPGQRIVVPALTE